MALCGLGPDFNFKPAKLYDGPQTGLIYIDAAKLKFGLLVPESPKGATLI